MRIVCAVGVAVSMSACDGRCCCRHRWSWCGQVVAVESNAAAVDRGMGMIRNSLDIIAKKSVTKGVTTEAAAKAHTDAVLGRITTATDNKALKDCDIVVEVRKRVVIPALLSGFA